MAAFHGDFLVALPLVRSGGSELRAVFQVLLDASVPAARYAVYVDARSGLREFSRQAGQNLTIDGNAAPLHAGEHRHQRALQRFVNGVHAFGDDASIALFHQSLGFDQRAHR